MQTQVVENDKIDDLALPPFEVLADKGKTMLCSLLERGYSVIEINPNQSDDNLNFEFLCTYRFFCEHLVYADGFMKGHPMASIVQPKPNAEGASSRGAGFFPLHVDAFWWSPPPRLLLMCCINPGAGGEGLPLLSDGLAAFNSLSKEHRQALLTHKLLIEAPNYINEGRVSCTSSLVSMHDDGSMLLRWDRGTAERAKEISELRPAIEAFNQAISDHTFSLEPRRGLCYVIDNWSILHGRTEIVSKESSERKWHRRYRKPLDEINSYMSGRTHEAIMLSK